MKTNSVKNAAANLRFYRKWHRYIGLAISLLILVSSATGILLAWKKNSDLLQPPTQKTSAHTSGTWLSVEEISQNALQAMKSQTESIAPEVDRLDVRPDKGIVKVLFKEGYWEVQVDGYTGDVLSVARRHSDWIEHIHDGSIISDAFKLLTMNALGIGLLALMISGIWLWAGPIKIRQLKKS